MSKMLKCASCGQWNTLTDEATYCQHCQQPFHTPSAEEHQSLERRKTMGEIKIPIHANDSWMVVAFKTVFNWVQIVFLGILSFILWLIAAGPG